MKDKNGQQTATTEKATEGSVRPRRQFTYLLLPEDVRQMGKTLAIREGCTLSYYIAEMIRERASEAGIADLFRPAGDQPGWESDKHEGPSTIDGPFQEEDIS